MPKEHDSIPTFQPGRRKLLQAAALLGACGLGGAPMHAWAQRRTVSLILPLSAGSGVDAVIRGCSEAWSVAAGSTIVVENRPGAGGLVGTNAITRAKPDGYTLGAVSNNHVIFPSVYKEVPFDPIKDITPITLLGATPLVLVVSPARLKVRDAQELIAALKAKPGEYTYASSGIGTIIHLGAEMFNQQAGVNATHIPYQGTGPMLNALLTGEVDYGIVALPPIRQHIESGMLQAVGTGSRIPVKGAPDLKALKDQGLPDYDVDGWFAVVGPAGIPAERAHEIYQQLVQAFADEKVQANMEAQGNFIRLRTPEETAAHMQTEFLKYQKVVQDIGLEPL